MYSNLIQMLYRVRLNYGYINLDLARKLDIA